MSVDILFKIAVDKKASDIHFHAGMPPVLRIDGNLAPIKGKGKLEGKKLGGVLLVTAHSFEKYLDEAEPWRPHG